MGREWLIRRDERFAFGMFGTKVRTESAVSKWFDGGRVGSERIGRQGSGLTTEAVGSTRAGIAQLARARAFQARGRGFESRFPLHVSRILGAQAHVAQAVERVLGKDEVSGSNPLVGSRF